MWLPLKKIKFLSSNLWNGKYLLTISRWWTYAYYALHSTIFLCYLDWIWMMKKIKIPTERPSSWATNKYGADHTCCVPAQCSLEYMKICDICTSWILWLYLNIYTYMNILNIMWTAVNIFLCGFGPTFVQSPWSKAIIIIVYYCTPSFRWCFELCFIKESVILYLLLPTSVTWILPRYFTV